MTIWAVVAIVLAVLGALQISAVLIAYLWVYGEEAVHWIANRYHTPDAHHTELKIR